MVTSTRVGVIGLGAMGAPMARRLVDAGMDVSITSSRPHPDLIEAGATWVDTSGEIGERCDVVLLMLPDIPELQEILDGPHGLVSRTRDLLLMIGSTSVPADVTRLAEDLRQRHGEGVRVVDCPVSGGVEGAAAGTLSIMVGGERADADLALSVLAPCGTPVHLGPLGAGQVAKACNQMVVAATMMAIGEASVLAERSGIDLGKMWDLLGGGYAGSRLLEVKSDMVVDEDYAPGGMAKYMVKDLRAATSVAEGTGTSGVVLPALLGGFEELVERGLGDNDIAVTRKFIQGR